MHAMLHLAQVQKNTTSGEMELQLLAHQKSEFIWELRNCESLLPLEEESFFPEGLLVLVELGDNAQIINIKEAKDWIVSLVKYYLSESAITPEFVEREQFRIEEWRQELTAQSLDLTRQHLEIETRREQLQELEMTLKEDQEQLLQQREQLQEWEERLKQEEEKLQELENHLIREQERIKLNSNNKS